MPITKKQIIEAIEAMPQTEFANVEEVIEEIILLEKIEKGLEAVRKGEVLSEEEIDKEIEKW
jgi:hypothetical protein